MIEQMDDLGDLGAHVALAVRHNQALIETENQDASRNTRALPDLYEPSSNPSLIAG